MFAQLPDWVFTGTSPGPALVFGLGAAALIYGTGLYRLWRRARIGNGITVWQAAAFYLGLATAGAALSPQLEAAAAVLFSAHMLQHMLLAFMAAPLLAWSLSGLALLWSLPKPARKNLGQLWLRSARVRMLVAGVTHPVTVWLLFALTFWLWHAPVMYEAALANPLLHALEHVTMLAAAGLFWWLVLQPSGRRRLPHGADILFTVTTMLQGMVLSSLISFAQTPQYRTYELSAHALGISALADQQLAGMLMRTPATIILVITSVWLFLVWISQLERRDLEFG